MTGAAFDYLCHDILQSIYCGRPSIRNRHFGVNVSADVGMGKRTVRRGGGGNLADHPAAQYTELCWRYRRTEKPAPLGLRFAACLRNYLCDEIRKYEILAKAVVVLSRRFHSSTRCARRQRAEGCACAFHREGSIALLNTRQNKARNPRLSSTSATTEKWYQH